MMNLSSLLQPRGLTFEAARKYLLVTKGYRFLRAYLNPWTEVGSIIDYDQHPDRRLQLEKRGYIPVDFGVVFPKENPRYSPEWMVRSSLRARLQELRLDVKEIRSVIDLHQERFGTSPEYIGLSRGPRVFQEQEALKDRLFLHRLLCAQISGD